MKESSLFPHSFLSTVRRAELANGLTLLTREERGSGVVALVIWVKTGYFHEPDDCVGMAHLIEHMFFKGSQRYPEQSSIAREVAAVGGKLNAATTYDSTSFSLVLPRESFERGLDIQADALAHPLFDSTALKKECEVVLEESRRKMDTPLLLATERMYATAFQRHRMRRWRLGSEQVLRTMQRERWHAFFESHYGPPNIIVAVAGDISHAEALSAIEKRFGLISRGGPSKERGPVEPSQDAFRFSEERADITSSYSIFGWHAPTSEDSDAQAVELLAATLGGGDFSRLHRNVVGADRAASIHASHVAFDDVGMFVIRASCADQHLERVEGLITEQVEKLKGTDAITPTELAVARRSIESSFAFEMETSLGQARALASHEARGSYELIAQRWERFARVEPCHVQRAAMNHLKLDNLSLHRYRPLGVATSDQAAAREHLSSAVAVASARTDKKDVLPIGRAMNLSIALNGSPQHFVLSNGMELFVQQALESSRTVSAAVSFGGGRLAESKENAGITELMLRLMRATTNLSEEQIGQFLAAFGARLTTTLEKDFFRFSLDSDRESFRSAFELLADVIVQPSFCSTRLQRQRHLQLAAIARRDDSSAERPFALLDELMYGPHSYALPQSGYLSTVERVDVHALRAWYDQQIAPGAASIIVVGNVNAEEVREVAEKRFGRMSPRPRHLSAPIHLTTPLQRELVEERKRRQSSIAVAFPAASRGGTDWIALRLLGAVTSGPGGTFFEELRSRRSLAYTVYAGPSADALHGSFVGYVATDASKEIVARDSLLESMRGLARGFNEDDVARAKSTVAGTTRIRLQTNAARVAELSSNHQHGLGIDFTAKFLQGVEAASLELLREVARKYLSTDNYFVATVRGSF